MQKYLDQPTIEKWEDAIIKSRFEYGNSLMLGISPKRIAQLQRRQIIELVSSLNGANTTTLRLSSSAALTPCKAGDPLQNHFAYT